jgi:hypothetical protein
MGLRIENIYKDIYLYIFIVLILIFIHYNKISEIRRILEKKWVEIYIILIISLLLNFKLKIGIITSVIYILLFLNKTI